MNKIKNTIFRNMTIDEITNFVFIWESLDIEFWDLVNLYSSDETI